MKVNLAKSIDYWVGVPVCFILSIFSGLEKLINPRSSRDTNPEKIMFLELSEMGSAILAYSAMKKAREIYSDAELYFWIFRKNEESVHILGLVPKENVITMRDDNLLLLFLDTLRNLWRIRKERIDIVIDMELFSRFTGILSYLSGSKIRVGFNKFTFEGLYRGNLHTHKVNYNPYIHISKNFLSLVHSLKVNPDDVPLLKESLEHCQTSVPEVKPSRQDLENMWGELKELNSQISERNKIVVLNPGINDILPLRRWPIKNYIELAKRILSDDGVFIVLIGLSSQSSDARLLTDALKSSRCLDFAGKTSVGDLIHLFNIASLFISHDSGAVGLASLSDIAMIVLYGPETPLLYEALTKNKKIFYKNFSCSPCLSAYNHRKSICKDNRCMQAITVDEVYDEAKEILK